MALRLTLCQQLSRGRSGCGDMRATNRFISFLLVGIRKLQCLVNPISAPGIGYHRPGRRALNKGPRHALTSPLAGCLQS